MIKVMVYGVEKEFSEEMIQSIVEEHFDRNYFKSDITALVTAVPTEGNWYVVEPEKIDQNLFREKRNDYYQEEVRRRILKAFANAQKNPERYLKPFKTMYPFRPWNKFKGKTFEFLREIAQIIGDDMADETEQVLEWAQRISIEGWETVCNKNDRARSYRAIRTEYPGLYKIYGATCEFRAKTNASATHIMCEQYLSTETAGATVPLVVSRSSIPNT